MAEKYRIFSSPRVDNVAVAVTVAVDTKKNQQQEQQEQEQQRHEILEPIIDGRRSKSRSPHRCQRTNNRGNSKLPSLSKKLSRQKSKSLSPTHTIGRRSYWKQECKNSPLPPPFGHGYSHGHGPAVHHRKQQPQLQFQRNNENVLITVIVKRVDLFDAPCGATATAPTATTTVAGSASPRQQNQSNSIQLGTKEEFLNNKEVSRITSENTLSSTATSTSSCYECDDSFFDSFGPSSSSSNYVKKGTGTGTTSGSSRISNYASPTRNDATPVKNGPTSTTLHNNNNNNNNNAFDSFFDNFGPPSDMKRTRGKYSDTSNNREYNAHTQRNYSPPPQLTTPKKSTKKRMDYYYYGPIKNFYYENPYRHLNFMTEMYNQGHVTVRKIEQTKKEKQAYQKKMKKYKRLGKSVEEDVANPYPSSEVHDKYWAQRHRLFQRFDEGVQLDSEGWYSVTPEVIADQVAQRVSEFSGEKGMVVLDCFGGMGGNSIAFGRQPADKIALVVCVDIDRSKLRMAAHNASLYEVPPDRILFIESNSIFLLDQCYREGRLVFNQNAVNVKPKPQLNRKTSFENHFSSHREVCCDYIIGGLDLLPSHIDAVFMDPPWGGIDYETVAGKDGYDLKKNMKIKYYDGVAPSMSTAGTSGTFQQEDFDKPAVIDGYVLLRMAAAAVKSKLVIYDLPRNTQMVSLGLAALSAGFFGNIRLDEHYLNGRLKTITAYLGQDFTHLVPSIEEEWYPPNNTLLTTPESPLHSTNSVLLHNQ